MALLNAPAVGPARYAKLLTHFGTPQNVFAASRSDLLALGLQPTTLSYLENPDLAPVEKALLWLDKPGNHLITWSDPDYPALLKEISQAPPLLFVHGQRALLSQTQLAIVGTRNPSKQGQQIAHDFAAYLAAHGMVVTSGLALGIDGAAHRGALDGHGLTIAVLGTGPDRIYPAAHRDLAHAIAEQGALISEFAPGTPALAEHFPRRNRLISGLTLGTLVVEAALKSGSLITARLAIEQGREVFAIPGSIHSSTHKGCHQLIREGAKLVETAADIVEELGPLHAAACALNANQAVAQSANTAIETSPDNEQSSADLAHDLDPDYQKLLSCIDDQPCTIDTLVERSGLTVDAVSSMLLILELQGLIVSAPGGFYARKPKGT